MSLSLRQGSLAAGVLLAAHLALALLPAPPFAPAMNLVLFATNLFVLYAGALTLRGRSLYALAGFLGGYLALVLLALVMVGSRPLFILLVIAYASVFGSPLLLGLFGLFVLSFVLLQPYAFETFIPLALVFFALVKARREASRFALILLGVGLLALAALLFPLLHLALQDSVQTLARTLMRPDVQEALAVSVGSSILATAIIAVVGVPLGYALARVDFPGKRSVEALVDLPILVPQSVAGVALIVLLGPGSPLGRALEDLGLRVPGTLLGLLVAQVFVASPFLIKSAMTAFEAVPLSLEHASRSLGASAAGTFLRISLPLASRGLMVGAALSFARAISEFGTIVLFASSPVSAPILVHTELLRAGTDESRPIAVLLLVVCLWFFLLLRFGRGLLPFSRRAGAGT